MINATRVTCPSCRADNRSRARYCKKCGTVVDTTTTDDLLGKIIGLPDVRVALEDLRATVEGMVHNKQEPRIHFHTLIVGNSGTAKSLIGDVMTSVLHKLNVIKKINPVTLDALTSDSLTPKILESSFETAKDGVLFIDNVHKLITVDGASTPLFNRLIKLMDDYPLNPVVIVAGLPFGLNEFLGKPQNTSLSARFHNIFRITDYPPGQLLAIAAHELSTQSFVLPHDVRLELERRLRWLYRRTRMGDPAINVLNGHLAIREAHAVAREYYKRRGSDLQLTLVDIKGPIEEDKTIDQILAELDAMTGMNVIKKDMRALYEDILHNRDLVERGLGKGRIFAFHSTITGNPGTGKTTVARLLGEIYRALGVLPSGHVVEVDRGKLVGQFQGHTAQAVHEICDKAMGGVLFVDEAYSLKQGDTDSFGQEAIDTLLKRMEDDRGKYIVLAAGYTDKMAEWLKTNPGLPSRFSKHFVLEDYTPAELTDIFGGMASQQGFKVDPSGLAAAALLFKDKCARKTREFANGREARSLVDTAASKQGERIRQTSPRPLGVDLMTITAADIPKVGGAGAARLETSMLQLNGLVGLKGVKSAVARLSNTLKAQQLLEETEVLARNFVFTGNPGTGKTTVARIIADIFFAIGLLPTNKLVEVDRSKLVKGFVGQTAPHVNEICDKALGGVLFMDEAYTLVADPGQGDRTGQEAIDVILKRMEDDRGKFVVIAAGYKNEMQSFINSNPGLRSRFTDFIDFEDYTPTDMVSIFLGMAKSRSLTHDADFDAGLLRKLEHIYRVRDRFFANARTVRTLFEDTNQNCANRVAGMAVDDDAKRIELRILRAEDLQDKDAVPAGGGGGQTGAPLGITASMRALNEMIGLGAVKRSVLQITQSLEGKRLLGDDELESRHFVFSGNPGTGKTTVARIFANILHAVGVLPTHNLVEVDRGKLVIGFIGQTAPNVHKICDQALGGVLFIDEAYTLADKPGSGSNWGQEAIDTLLKRMEDDRGKFVVIAAGYTAEMQSFVDSNPGLRSRFTDFIEFDDYQPNEMLEIFASSARRKQLTYDADFEAALRARFESLYAARGKTFANARTVRIIFEKVRNAASTRVTSMAVDEATRKVEIRKLQVADIPDGL